MNASKLIHEVRQLLEHGEAGKIQEYEDDAKLPPLVRDMHRALMTLEEELRAMDDYSQRIEVVQDEKLKKVLQHLLDEEKQHAAMLVDWIKNADPGVTLPKE